MPVGEVLAALAGAAALTASMLAAPTPSPPQAISDPGSPSDENSARNKPGRKPLNDVPATKRTAQNRASQRAFRERRQAHLAELEGKVKRYETERTTIASQLAMLAQRVRDETPRIHALETALQARDNEIAQWRARCSDLSRALDALQAVVRSSAQNPIRPPISTTFGAPCAGPGSLPGAHRASTSQVGSAADSAASPWYHSPSELQKPDRHTSHGLDDRSGTSPAPMASSPAETSTSGGSDPAGRLQLGAINMPSTLSGIGMGMSDMGPTLPPLGSLTGLMSGSSLPSPDGKERSKGPTLPPRATGQSQSSDSNTFNECGFCAGDKAMCICRADSPSTEVEINPPSEILSTPPAPAPGATSTTAPIPATAPNGLLDDEDDSGCGGCVKGGDCACRGDGIIDFDAGGPASEGTDPSNKPGVAPSPPLVATDASQTQAVDKDMTLSLTPLALTGDALPLRRRRSDKEKGKLWAVNNSSIMAGNTASSAPRPSLATSSGAALDIHRGPASRRGGTKLWVTSTPECSGDPRTCAACGTDPELAAFCEAVNEEDELESGDKEKDEAAPEPLSPPNPASRRPPLPPHTLSAPLSTSCADVPPSPPHTDQAETTVPEAWRRIRSHPHFQEFTHESGNGGLHLLADVVAGRHHSTAPSSSHGSPVLGHRMAKVPRPRLASTSASSDTAAARRASGLFALATLTRSSVDETRGRENSRDDHTAHSSSKPLYHRAQSVSGDPMDVDDASEPVHKRRRLYVDNDGIRNALALLDRGILSAPRQGPAPPVWAERAEPLTDFKGTDA